MDYLLKEIETYDKALLNRVSGKRKRDPKPLKELALETAAYHWKQLSFAILNPDTLWLLFKTVSRAPLKLTDEFLQKIAEETDCLFIDVEKYEIRFNDAITSKGIKYLTMLMPNLQYIDLTGSTTETEIQTYQHLFSRSKLKEIRSWPPLETSWRKEIETIANALNWKVTPWIEPMTRRL